MATKLDKDITRESSVQIDGREINITLTDKQEVKLKLKGMKSGELVIGIEDLYKRLSGQDDDESNRNIVVEPSAQKSKSLSIITKEEKAEADSPMINLHDLRSLNAISGLDLPTLTKFDGILAELIRNDKERKAALKKNVNNKKK